MSLSQVVYRARQLWAALRTPPLTWDELEPARLILTEHQMLLFARLQPAEQVHSLDVLQTLRNRGEGHPDLLVAALLHDIGKILHPLRSWERVVIVLGKTFFPERSRTWGESAPRGLARPFVVASRHPAWGAELAQKAGTNPLVVHLIREHHNDPGPTDDSSLESHLLSLLRRADRQN